MADNFKNMIILEPGSPWDGGTWSDPVSDPLGRCRYPINPTAAYPATDSPSRALELATEQALGFGSGATIRIMPGTAPYEFDSPVNLVGPNRLTIIQEKGAIIKQTSAAAYVFGVQCQLDYYGLDAQYDISDTTSGRSLFRLTSSATAGIPSSIATTGTGEMTITRTDAGSWIAGGAAAGMRVRTQDYANAANNSEGAGNGANNSGWVILEVVSATVLKCRDIGDVAVTESSAGGGTATLLDRAPNLTLHGGYVSLAQTNAAIPGYYVVRAEGSDQNVNMMSRNVTIRDVTLEIRDWTLPVAGVAGPFATQSTNSWTGAEYTSVPYGIGLLKAMKFRGVDVQGCKYIGTSPVNTYNYGGVFIALEDCLEANLSGFVISSINTGSSATGKAALPLFLLTSPSANEGGHILISDIFAENIVAKHLVCITDGSWVRVMNFTCGRWSAARSRSCIRALNGRNIQVLIGNTHNYQGFTNGGTFSCSTSTHKFTGTNISEGLEAGMYVLARLFSAAVDGTYKVASVGGANEFTVDTAYRDIPENVTGDANELIDSSPWVCDFDSVNDYYIDIQDHTFRKGHGPLHNLTDSVGYVGPSEYIDYGPLSYV